MKIYVKYFFTHFKTALKSFTLATGEKRIKKAVSRLHQLCGCDPSKVNTFKHRFTMVTQISMDSNGLPNEDSVPSIERNILFPCKVRYSAIAVSIPLIKHLFNFSNAI